MCNLQLEKKGWIFETAAAAALFGGKWNLNPPLIPLLGMEQRERENISKYPFIPPQIAKCWQENVIAGNI